MPFVRLCVCIQQRIRKSNETMLWKQLKTWILIILLVNTTATYRKNIAFQFHFHLFFFLRFEMYRQKSYMCTLCMFVCTIATNVAAWQFIVRLYVDNTKRIVIYLFEYSTYQPTKNVYHFHFGWCFSACVFFFHSLSLKTKNQIQPFKAIGNFFVGAYHH